MMNVQSLFLHQSLFCTSCIVVVLSQGMVPKRPVSGVCQWQTVRYQIECSTGHVSTALIYHMLCHFQVAVSVMKRRLAVDYISVHLFLASNWNQRCCPLQILSMFLPFKIYFTFLSGFPVMEKAWKSHGIWLGHLKVMENDRSCKKS